LKGLYDFEQESASEFKDLEDVYNSIVQSVRFK